MLAAAQLFAQAGMLEGFIKGEEEPEPKQSLPRFQEYAEQWYAQYKKGNRHTTKKSATSLYTKHLYPFFGDMCLDEITTDVIQDFLNMKAEENYAKKTVHEMRLQLGMVLESAKEDRPILDNPARSKRLVIPTSRKTVRQPLTHKQALDVIGNLDKLKSQKDRLYVALFSTQACGAVRYWDYRDRTWMLSKESSMCGVASHLTKTGLLWIQQKQKQASAIFRYTPTLYSTCPS